MIEQDFSSRSQDHALALSIEQAVPETVLHALDHPAERRLREVNDRGGPAHAAGLGDGEKGPQLTFVKIHAFYV